MFKSGFPIATDQASDEVKNRAARVSNRLDDEGFAHAVQDFILGAA